jgi:hypothetical protein
MPDRFYRWALSFVLTQRQETLRVTAVRIWLATIAILISAALVAAAFTPEAARQCKSPGSSQAVQSDTSRDRAAFAKIALSRARNNGAQSMAACK